MSASRYLSDDEFVRAIARHRGASAAPLQFQPKLEALLDLEAFQQLSEDMRLASSRWETLKVADGIEYLIPELRGIYMFVWVAGPTIHFADDRACEHKFAWILYIGKAGIESGKSDTLRHRYRNDYRKYAGGDPSVLWRKGSVPKGRGDLLKYYLTLRPLEYWYLPLSDVKQIENLERRLKDWICPPLNTQVGRRLKPAETRPAFG